MAGPEKLGKELDDYIEALVKSGRYESRDAVLKEGLRLVRYKESRLAELNAALDRGLAESEAGLGTPIEEVTARLKAKYAAMSKDRKKEARG